ncbi:MAG: UDP-3-O-(3-hydroxymyristoyl)glucosamine N-acyltransferase [Bacteroidales bacterium]|nr:UDP-3-O-(3-hydroxymyristoyl)glucosamine N-acyltransferase [Bacteroidales bacterium]
MTFQQSLTIDELIQLIGHPVTVKGDSSLKVTGINELHSIQKGNLTFVDHGKYYLRILQSEASAILINSDEVECPEGKVLLISDDPLRDYIAIVKHFTHFTPQNTPIHPSAVIGEGTIIQPLVFIGENVRIGKNCIIHSNVSIYADTVIGDNVVIHSNSTIGADACYFQKRPDGWLKLASCGDTYIGNNVEIGCNCCIDRGVSGTTYIDDGCIFDNLVQVGHDTHIGKRTLLGAQCGVAGCTYIDDDCKIWAKAAVNKDLYIAKGTVLLALSAIDKDVKEEGRTLFGMPAGDAQQRWREMAMMRKLPDLYRELEEIKKKLGF